MGKDSPGSLYIVVAGSLCYQSDSTQLQLRCRYSRRALQALQSPKHPDRIYRYMRLETLPN